VDVACSRSQRVRDSAEGFGDFKSALMRYHLSGRR